jgi:hypothetical protein
MALARAPKGDEGQGLDFEEVKKALLALGAKEAKVVFRVHEVHPPEMMNQEVYPVTADMIVCTGPSKGKALMNFRYIWKGITGPLRKAHAQGTPEVAARLEVKSGKSKWVAAQTPNDDDFDLIAAFYGDGSKVWDKTEPLVEGGDEGYTSNGLVRAGAGSDDSDLPPF